MTHERELLLKEAPISKAVTKLATPAVIGMLISAIYNIVDTFFVGMLNDTAALGATTVLFPVFMLIGAVGLTFGMGASTVISRRLGEQNKKGASEIASTAFFSSFIVAILFTITGLFFIEPLLKLFGATSTILTEAKTYGSIILAGSLFQMLNMTMNNMLRAEGASSISGFAIALGAILNIIFDPIFIFSFDMGLSGAALATITGQGISTLVLLSYYIRKKSIIRLSILRFKPKVNNYKLIMTIGIPTFFRQSLNSIAIGILTNAAETFGDSTIAAIGLTLRINMIPMMVLFGFGQGFMPVAGYAYGANNIARVRGSIQYSIKWTTIFSTISAILLFAGAPLIISSFSNDTDVIKQGIMSMRLSVTVLPFLGFVFMYNSLYQALGMGKQALFLAVVRQGVMFIPLVLILSSRFGIIGVFSAQPIANLLTVFISVYLAIKMQRSLKKMEFELAESISNQEMVK